MRKHPSIIIAVVALGAMALVLVLGRSISAHRLRAKCYFQDARGLRVGAEVRVAGVAVGSVTSVRVRPDLRDHPAEVEMLINTSYDLKIPDDAVVSLESDGLLGNLFADINIEHASGRPLAEGGVLRTRESPAMADWLQCVSNIMDHKPCDLRGRAESSKPGPPSVPASR